MKKSLTIASILALSCVGGLQAYDGYCCGGSCYDYGVNPPTFYDSCGFTGSISYLYWKPYQDDNAFVNVITPNNDDLENLGRNLNDTNVHTKLKEPNYQWDSGFQVSIGYLLPCDRWGLSLNWTHYETDVSNNVSTTPGAVQSTFVGGSSYFTLDGFASGEAEADWKLMFNQVDLDFSREFYVGKCMTLTPYVGLRALLIREKYRITTNNFTEEFEGIFEKRDETFISRLESDFKSLGLKGGLQSFYEIGCGIGIYGDFGASVVFGAYDACHRFNSIFILESIEPNFTSFGSNFLSHDRNALRATLDLSLGLKWSSAINCDQGQVFVLLGWDHHLYFNQSSFLELFQKNGQPEIQARNSNLYLYGLKVQIGAAF